VLRDGTIGGQKPLGLSWRLEPLHPALSLAGRLMGVCSAVVQVAMLPVLDSWQELALGRPIALQLIRDHHARDVPQAFEQLAEEFLGTCLVAAPVLQLLRRSNNPLVLVTSDPSPEKAKRDEPDHAGPHH
jgi:hypothetical protein